MSALGQILQEEISRSGPLSFARFMELALYCPEYGYYRRAAMGRHGDFYTNVSVGPLFGELLASEFSEWLAAPGMIAEAGAHDGQLAWDILTWLQRHRPAVYHGLCYWIVEPLENRARQQAHTLEKFAGKVRWCESLASLPSVRGLIFSNELLDALPVHRYVWSVKQQRWFEMGVDLDKERFDWKKLRPVSGEELAPTGIELTGDLMKVLPDGYTLDVSHAAADWWRRAAQRLTQGRLVAIDYGFSAAEFLTPERTGGTLRAYRKHLSSNDLLANPGEQDLTAHVHFSYLQHVGEGAGLRTEVFTSQERWLTQLAHLDMPRHDWTPERIRQFQTLTHPEHLGRSFKVLVQSR